MPALIVNLRLSEFKPEIKTLCQKHNFAYDFVCREKCENLVCLYPSIVHQSRPTCYKFMQKFGQRQSVSSKKSRKRKLG